MTSGVGIGRQVEPVPSPLATTGPPGQRVPAKAPARAPAKVRRTQQPAEERPVARVCVDVGLAHLDRPFDYLVPGSLAAQAVPGCRVRVRFAGQLVDGYLLDRVDASEHGGRLSYLERVVSAEPVLHPEVVQLARAVADRYAGTLADVLRLGVPPRHARAEQDAAAEQPPAAEQPAEPVAPAEQPAEPVAPAGHTAVDDAGWSGYPAGPAFLRALADGRAPRAVWTAAPGEDWPVRLAEAVLACAAAGRGALVIVADQRDLDRLDAAVSTAIAASNSVVRHVAISAALGPAQRYRRFLAASRGQASIVIGTRAVAFAPVHKLGLVVIWDDGDDLHAEPRAPYPHARQVVLIRAELTGCAALLGGYSRSAEAQQLIEAGWAKELTAHRDTVRRRAPQVLPVGDDVQLARDPAAASARLPSVAWRAARDALAAGAPVLVQVPRRGYLPSVACAQCHSPARCPNCAGPLALSSAQAPPACRWCARPAAGFACSYCGGRRLRASVTGARRTAEELARAFPGASVRTSGRDGVLASVPAERTLVVATPGAEPVAEGGYGAVLLLDTWALLTRADLRAGEETLRRWLAAAALARPAAAGGRVVVVADGALPTVQALVRFDPGWLAARELAERRELRFPPAARVASVTGVPSAVADLLAAVHLPAGAEVLGPVPAAEGKERMLVRTSRSAGATLAAALKAAAGVRSARKAPDPVRIQVDPLELL